MRWTEGSGAGHALVKHKEHGWAAAVYCQLVALHEHLSWGFTHEKESGFLFLPHPKKMITPAPEHNRVKIKQLWEKLSHALDRSCSFTPHAEDIRDVPTAGTWDFHPKPGMCTQKQHLSMWKATGATQHCHCSPLDWVQMQQQLEAVGMYRWRSGAQFPYLPTRKDALMLSRNYSLQVFCISGVNKTCHQWGWPGQRKCQ